MRGATELFHQWRHEENALFHGQIWQMYLIRAKFREFRAKFRKNIGKDSGKTLFSSFFFVLLVKIFWYNRRINNLGASGDSGKAKRAKKMCVPPPPPRKMNRSLWEITKRLLESKLNIDFSTTYRYLDMGSKRKGLLRRKERNLKYKTRRRRGAGPGGIVMGKTENEKMKWIAQVKVIQIEIFI